MRAAERIPLPRERSTVPDKVWVIAEKSKGRSKVSRAGSRVTEARIWDLAPQLREGSGARGIRPQGSWPAVIAAYVAGPLLAARGSFGRRRWAWGALGVGSLLAAVGLAYGWNGLLDRAQRAAHGDLLWIGALAMVSTGLALSWVRAIRVAAGRSPLPCPAGLRHPGTIVSAGLLVPGLGFLLAGKPRRGALAFAIPVLLASSGLVLAHSARFWGRPDGLSPAMLEGILLTCAVSAGFLAIAWIVQALDPVRLVSEGRPSRSAPALSLVLLVALGVFTLTARQEPLARQLHDVAGEMRARGFVRTPWILCETAARLDPARAAYLADAAAMNEALGRTDAAAARRSELEARASEYQAAVRGSADTSASRSGDGTAWSNFEPALWYPPATLAATGTPWHPQSVLPAGTAPSRGWPSR